MPTDAQSNVILVGSVKPLGNRKPLSKAVCFISSTKAISFVRCV